MDTLLAAGTFVAVVALVYAFCLRPMRNGRCAMSPQEKCASDPAQIEQVALMRAEVAVLRNQVGAGALDDRLADHT